MFAVWLAAAGASIQLGESAQPVAELGLEEVVTGDVPVSEDEEVVEQPVEEGDVASQVSGFEPPYQSSEGRSNKFSLG